MEQEILLSVIVPVYNREIFTALSGEFSEADDGIDRDSGCG